MRLMSACENKEDRDIIADEIFSDLTGTPRLPPSLPRPSHPFPARLHPNPHSIHPIDHDHKPSHLRTGELDAAAQRKLDAAPGTCFYQVLAHHYQGNPADATTLLVLCRSLWANKVITAVYGLVLHRWILDSRCVCEIIIHTYRCTVQLRTHSLENFSPRNSYTQPP